MNDKPIAWRAGWGRMYAQGDSVRVGHSLGHGHLLPDGPREPITYEDGCMATPLDGEDEWVFTPVDQNGLPT